MRAQRRITGSRLSVTAITETPILVAVEMVRSLVTTGVYALDILSGQSLVGLQTMIETGSGHVTSYRLVVDIIKFK